MNEPVSRSTLAKNQLLYDCLKYAVREILKGRPSFHCFLLLLQTSISLTISLIHDSSKYLPIYRKWLRWLNNRLATLAECIKGFASGKMKCWGNVQALKIKSYLKMIHMVQFILRMDSVSYIPGTAGFVSCSKQTAFVVKVKPRNAI